MTQHLNARVAWHDNRWNGAVCRFPSLNAFCVELDRIRAERDDIAQDSVALKEFADLAPTLLPVCHKESGGFMNKREWWREFNHPYKDISKAAQTHGVLKPTKVKVPPFSTFAVPFLWMLKDQQARIEQTRPTSLPPDADSPFKSPWVFGRERQEALCQLVFDQLTPGKSLVTFYTKSGQPISESISRLVVAIGHITWVTPLQWYESNTAKSYPLWDRLFSHSIRPSGSDGFLLPYHDYLDCTGDPTEDERRKKLLIEIAVVPEPSQIMAFSYAGELSSPDLTLSTLVRCLDSVRKIREHGIAEGPWARREEWLNEQIGSVWQERGAFPGAGAALEAIGMRLGTSMVMELLSKAMVGSRDDPWPVLDAILRWKKPAPQTAYNADLSAVRSTWEKLPEERRALLKLLSRFNLSPAQATRWFDIDKRADSTRSRIDDASILGNPYRIVENDLGDAAEHPVSLGVVDRGLLPESTIAAAHPVPEPSNVGSPLDARRVRGAICTVLRDASVQGDTLLSVPEALVLMGKLNLPDPLVITTDWLSGNVAAIEEEVQVISIEPGVDSKRVECLQLRELKERETKLASLLEKRSAKQLPSLAEDWPSLLITAIREAGAEVKPESARHKNALEEQAAALEVVTTRRLSALVGRAGTGKTTVLGALLKSQRLSTSGVLFLAPTGKARVRITQKTNQTAMTVAQFLNSLGRYDSARQRPLFTGKNAYRKEKVAGALARLTVELRTIAGAPSDALRLASWYTREPQAIDADRVLSDLELGKKFNDLSIVFWKTEDDLHRQLDAQLVTQLGLATADDVVGFNAALGLTKEGWVPFNDHQGAEKFQILSPVRLHPHGVYELNRRIQRRFRAAQLKAGRTAWGLSLGDEEIVWGDKVILLRNGRREGWNGKKKESVEEYLANGEIGVANVGNGAAKNKLLNIAFAGRPDVRFGFSGRDFKGDSSALELAYALTVHKAQGSEFGTVFVVLPRQSRLLTRELLYTALTRAQKHLVLLIEGDDVSFLYDLTRPEKSETARRNSNLFAPGIRHEADGVPFAEHLIHRTARGELVRSKSELVIANRLHSLGFVYHYERPFEGVKAPGKLRPDFSFINDAGDVFLWEHLGMLQNAEYRAAWEWKRKWYEENNLVEDVNLFTTEESNGLDTAAIDSVAERLRRALDD